MKLDYDFIITHSEKIKSTIYAQCIDDLEFQFNFNVIKCFNSIVYKFSLKNNELFLVKEFAKVDVDRSIIFEEIEIPVKNYYGKFNVIGDIFALINWIEN